jgi:predicted chitinase
MSAAGIDNNNQTSETVGMQDLPEVPNPPDLPDHSGPDPSDVPDVSDIGHPPDAPATPVAATAVYHVIARGGLLVRGGPGTEFPALRSLPNGSQVSVLKREGQWALIDVQGDKAADGYVFSSFLDAAAAAPIPTTVEASSEGDQFIVVKPPLLQLIMDRCANTKIKSKLDLGVVSDALTRSMLKADANNRKREIGFLSQAVIETDYFRTFEEYGKGAGKPYFPYYGRGIHQLTWRDTYAKCSRALFSDDRLVRDPDLILKDIEVNVSATAWFWRDYKKLNPFADAGNIDEIIHLVYGGKITSTDPKVRKSVLLRRSYYKTIDGLLDQHSV